MIDRSASHPRCAAAARRRPTPSATTLAALIACAACGGRAGGIRVEDLPAAPPDDPGYHVAPGDVLSVRVLNQDAMSQSRARVRDDGRISVPFLQDVEVAGATPAALSRRLEAALRTYVVNPVVTVTVDEVRPLRISVIGEVAHPGAYELERSAGVLAALAAAGGLSMYAHRDAVYVLRPVRPAAEGAPTRIRFTFSALTRAERPAASFVLRQGDTVVVE
ncbi:MAG TPA: polysaccharide biosynthesis/export family protein [Anaeromyxobacter sp.]